MYIHKERAANYLKIFLGTFLMALSTALFVMGTEKAIDFCKSHKEIDVILVTKDMKIYATEGLEKIMTMEDGLTYEKIKR